MPDCRIDANILVCNCTYPCAKKGLCCECIHYHRELGELPACYFPTDAEKTGNRSIENFINIYQKRGRWW